MRSLEIGLVLPMEESWTDGATPRWAEIRELAARAEEIGFDTVWVPDELLWRPANGETRGPAVPVDELNDANPATTDAHASVRTDGREVFFYSNRPGGLGLHLCRQQPEPDDIGVEHRPHGYPHLLALRQQDRRPVSDARRRVHHVDVPERRQLLRLLAGS